MKIGKLEEEKRISKDLFLRFKSIVDKITSAHENYAVNFGKNETIKNDSIKEERE